MQNIITNSECIVESETKSALFVYPFQVLNQSCDLFFLKYHPPLIWIFLPEKKEGGHDGIVGSQCGSGFKPAWVVAVCANARLRC